MDKRAIKETLDQILDELSAFEHERWSHWQKYLHSRGVFQSDGSLLLPAGFVERWEEQIATPYQKLSDQEKESDREQVRKYLPLIIETLSISVAAASENSTLPIVVTS